MYGCCTVGTDVTRWWVRLFSFWCTDVCPGAISRLFTDIHPIMSTEDFSHLPPEQKISHTVWKVRLQGYEELIQQFERSRDENDACFANLAAKPELLRGIAIDANVVAQETGLLAIAKFLELGSSPAVVGRLKTHAGLVPSLCEKGLSSSRAGTKQHAISALLLLVEISSQADWVLEQMTPYFSHKLPKLVAGCVVATHAMVENFGCNIVPVKMLFPVLSKLFAHADRNVRVETTRLAVEMRRWLGETLDQVLLPSLKPVQQRDLKAEFNKISGDTPHQKRLTRAQKEAEAQRHAGEEAEDMDRSADGDVAMEDASAVDPMDLLDPVDVISNMPTDLALRMALTKWKDRKEALEEVCAVLSKAPKMAAGDYAPLVRMFAKCMKDANIQVVQLAANGVEFLCKGLRGEFQKYMGLVVTPLLERSKEKKPAVAEALANALDAVFNTSSLSDVLDDTLEGMRHKTPQVKISATNYLQRCLKNTTVAPKAAQVDAIMEVGVKLLTDSQEPIRQASTEMIGTLMKITGERDLKVFLEKIDDNRLQKVKKVFEEATVKVVKNSNARAPAATAKVAGLRPEVKLKGLSAIPSKRLATSPAKRDLSKVPVKSFTGRLLISPSLGPNSEKREARESRARSDPPTVPLSVHTEAVNALKEENRLMKEELAHVQKSQNSLLNDITNLQEENAVLNETLQRNQSEVANADLMVKQKDTQVMRLSSDLDNAKLKIKSLEQSIEMLKLQQSTAQVQPLLSSYPEKLSRSPFRLPEKSQRRMSLQELSTRVDRMSIDGQLVATEREVTQEPSQEFEPASSSRDYTNSTGEEENWRKAAEVTAQLKARIEKMKQRNRLSSR